MNIMKIHYLLFILTFTVLLSSCLKSEDTDAEKRQKEEQQIVNYVKTKGYNIQPSSSGLYYIPEIAGTGEAPGDSDFVVIRYRGWTLDDKLFDSTDSTDVRTNLILPWFALSGPLKFSMGVYFPGWIETFKNMRVGGKSIAIMPSILSFNDYIPRKYEFELLEVIHNNYIYEKEKISNYVTSKGKELSDSTSSGLYFFETVAGTGAAPSAGKVAYVKYTGKLIDGRVFDQFYSTKSGNFTVGANSNIEGFNEAVNLMKEGGKATVVIPYYRGYGKYYQVNELNQIVIPWSSSLVFDIELVDVQ